MECVDVCVQVLVHIEEQSPDIGQSVHGMGTKSLEEIGAGGCVAHEVAQAQHADSTFVACPGALQPSANKEQDMLRTPCPHRCLGCLLVAFLHPR